MTTVAVCCPVLCSVAQCSPLLFSVVHCCWVLNVPASCCSRSSSLSGAISRVLTFELPATRHGFSNCRIHCSNIIMTYRLPQTVFYLPHTLFRPLTNLPPPTVVVTRVPHKLFWPVNHWLMQNVLLTCELLTHANVVLTYEPFTEVHSNRWTPDSCRRCSNLWTIHWCTQQPLNPWLTQTLF